MNEFLTQDISVPSGMRKGCKRWHARSRSLPGETDEAAAESAAVAQADTIDQVRDLLFGQEARAQRAEIDALRKALTQQLERVDAKLTDRLDKLSDQLAAEVRSLEAALGDEGKARAEGDDALRAELAQTDSALAELDQRMQAEHEAIRKQLAEEATALREALEAAMSALSQRLADTQADLDDRKADRSAIAALLRGVADDLAGSGDG